jgi:hypothetical protein
MQANALSTKPLLPARKPPNVLSNTHFLAAGWIMQQTLLNRAIHDQFSVEKI